MTAKFLSVGGVEGNFWCTITVGSKINSPVILAENLCRSNEFGNGKVLLERTRRYEWGISVIIFHRQHLEWQQKFSENVPNRSVNSEVDSERQILAIRARLHPNT